MNAIVAVPSREADARMPVRPAIPVTLWGLVAIILAERAVLHFGMPRSFGSIAVAVGVGVGACLLAVLAMMRKAMGRGVAHVPAVLPFVLASVLVGALLGWLALGRVNSAAEALSTTPVSAWGLEVEGDMAEGGRGWWGRCSRPSRQTSPMGRRYLPEASAATAPPYAPVGWMTHSRPAVSPTW